MVSGMTQIDQRAAAMAIRRAHFPNEIRFFAPGLKKYAIEGFEQTNPNAFLPVSVTGAGCSLKRDHCDKKILKPMIPLDHQEGLFNLCKRMKAKGTEGVLISGVFMKNGETPLGKHYDDIARIKQELGLNVMVHTGLVRSASTAKALKKAGVDGVALDIIGAEETIREVYHLDATPADFDRSLELLAAEGVRPHVILGLHYGKIVGEYAALDMIAKYPIHSLIVVILTPLHGTPMFGVTPPPVEEVGDFLCAARAKLPDTWVMLGCARPLGQYKIDVDHLAVECGINGIAYPAEGIVEHGLSLGLKPLFYENSCSCGA